MSPLWELFWGTALQLKQSFEWSRNKRLPHQFTKNLFEGFMTGAKCIAFFFFNCWTWLCFHSLALLRLVLVTREMPLEMMLLSFNPLPHFSPYQTSKILIFLSRYLFSKLQSNSNDCKINDSLQVNFRTNTLNIYGSKACCPGVHYNVPWEACVALELSQGELSLQKILTKPGKNRRVAV